MVDGRAGAGRHRLVSVLYGLSMAFLIAGYLTLSRFSGSSSNVSSDIVSFFAVVTFLTFIYAIYIKPQYAPLPKTKTPDEFLDLLKRTQHHQNTKRICAYCQIEKPEKARHCFICKRCVLGHDRHCFMLNNCVGKDNRVFVITYLTSTSVLLASILISAILSLTGT